MVSEPIQELKVECVSTSSQVEEAKPQETNNVDSYANVVENSPQQSQVQAGSSSSTPAEVDPTPQVQAGSSSSTPAEVDPTTKVDGILLVPGEFSDLDKKLNRGI